MFPEACSQFISQQYIWIRHRSVSWDDSRGGSSVARVPQGSENTSRQCFPAGLPVRCPWGTANACILAPNGIPGSASGRAPRNACMHAFREEYFSQRHRVSENACQQVFSRRFLYGTLRMCIRSVYTSVSCSALVSAVCGSTNPCVL